MGSAATAGKIAAATGRGPTGLRLRSLLAAN